MLNAGKVRGGVCLALLLTAGMRAAEGHANTLYLVAPAQAFEGANTLVEKGRVFLGEVVTNDVAISLSSDPPVLVPAAVTIPAGRSSVEFPISVGDDNFYSPNFPADIRAHSDGLTDASVTLVITDNDSSRMRALVPPIIWEGEAMQGVIALDAPRRTPLEVTLQLSSWASLSIPNKVIVPAGETFAPFPIGFVAEVTSANLEASASDGTGATAYVRAHKNDPVPTALYVKNDSRTPFVGDAIQLRARLAGNLDIANTNAVGQLRLLDPLGLTAFVTQTIQFTNGLWSGTATIYEAAPDLQFEVTAAGLTNSTPLFDVTEGVVLKKSAIDAQWNHATGLFYVSEGPVTNATGKLFAFSPTNALTIVKSLDLPLPATHLTVSDDGSTGWLVLTNRKIVRVDLNNWTLGEPFNPSTNAFELVRDIVLLRNETEKFVAVFGSNSGQWRIQLFTNGVPSGAVVKFSASSFDGAELVAGGDASELFCQTRDVLYRLVVDALGVRVQKQIQFWGSPPRPFIYAQGRLYSRGGMVLDAQTLELLLNYDAERTSFAVLPFPELNRALQITPGSALTFNAATGEILADTPARVSAFTLGWNEGLAAFLPNEIAVSRFPMSSGNADLALKFVGPTLYTNMSSEIQWDLQWEFEVENLGPDAASHVHLWSQWGRPRVGSLKAGERRRLFLPIGVSWNGYIEAQVRLTSPTEDPNPSNNTAHAITWVRSNVKILDGHQLNMAATALAGLPNLERIYVAYSKRFGSDAPGIAVIDTLTGEIVRTINTGTNVSRLAVSADAQYLFGIEGTNLVRRWRVDSGALEHTWEFDATEAFDIAAAPFASDAVVIATAERVAVYRDDALLPAVFDQVAARRAIFAIGDVLLLVDDPGPGSAENLIHKFRITDAGLVGREGPYALPGPSTGFTYAGPWLFGDLLAFNPVTNEQKEMYWPTAVDFSDEGVVVTIQGNKAMIRDSSLGLLHEEMLPIDWSAHATRFADRGVAIASADNHLVLYRLAALPIINSAADLEVSVKPPEPLYFGLPATWEFTVTNRSAAPAVNTHLVIEPDLSVSALNLEVADAMMVNGSATIALGDIPRGGSKTIRTVLHPQTYQVRIGARAFSNSTDPEPTNNVAVFQAYPPWPPAEFEMSVSATNRATIGEEVPVAITVRNAGDLALPNVRMFVSLYTEGAKLVGLPPADFPLEPGETKMFNGRLTITGPGLIGLDVGVFNYDYMNSGTTSGGRIIYVPPQGEAPASMAMPNSQIFAWNGPRNEIVAAFQAPGIVAGLDPKTLEPRWTVPLSGARWLLPTSDGSYVWVARAERVSRINVAETRVDRDFAVDPGTAEVRSMTSPAGQPDVLVVSLADNFAGKTKVFRNGAALPGELAEFGWLTMSADGRLFLASYRQSGLQELTLNDSGLSVLKEFQTDHLPEPITAFEGKIYYLSGRVFDLATELMQTPQQLANWTGVDPMTRRIYRAHDVSGGGELTAQQVDAQIDWRIFLDREVFRTTMGTNGVLLSDRFGTDARVLTFEAASQVDLKVESSMPQTVPGRRAAINVGFSVRNLRPAPAKNVRLSIDLPSGISVGDSNGFFLPITHLEATFAELDYSGAYTNFVLRFDADMPGEIVARVISDGSEADPTNNETRFPFAVAPLPVVLMDDLTLSESGAATMWLSAPAPRELRVFGVLQPITGDSADIGFGEPVFYFPQGATKASVYVMNNDKVPELPETFRLSVQASELFLVRTQAVLTVLNDDYPAIRGSTNSVREGNSGITTVSVMIRRDAAPFASEVEYETVSGTAVASRDFEPVSGRLHFAAGETSKMIQLRVIGNTEFDTSKQFSILLKNPVDATIGGNGLITISNDDPPAPFSLTITRLATGRYLVSFPAAPNVGYSLQYKSDLNTATWGQIFDGSTTFSGTNGQFEFWPEIPRSMFVRVLAVPR
jgi:hypothetical protein